MVKCHETSDCCLFWVTFYFLVTIGKTSECPHGYKNQVAAAGFEPAIISWNYKYISQAIFDIFVFARVAERYVGFSFFRTIDKTDKRFHHSSDW
jgi:hypothetical protein